MGIIRHISFLQAVFKHSFTAFGGPQVHTSLMQYRFVEKRKDITNEELLEYNAFCQLLPGASSTQTIVLVAYKRGGVSLALLTLLVWMLPACSIMTLAAVAYLQFDMQQGLKYLRYLQPMSIGFIASATLLLYKKAINSAITKIIFILASIIVIMGFKTPWTIPVIIILAGFATNFSKKRIPNDGAAPKKINWSALLIFAALFLTAGFLSEQSTRHNWKFQKAFNLLETNYRFGSFVFGGGDVLIPMMYEQYVTRPNSPRVIQNKRDVIKISSDAFLTGSGLVRAVPGPIFSIASYTGAMALKDKGITWQIIGAIIASVGVFLPSFLIVLFFFPIWQMLKRYAIFYRSLEGINAAVVGIMLGATLYLSKDIGTNLMNDSLIVWTISLATFIASTYLIYKQKLATQWIVLLVILLGIIGNFIT
jgi:chromate transporter